MSAGFYCLPCFREVISRTSIVATVLATLACGAYTQSQNGTLAGLICDPQHNAISGVEVQLFRADASRALTPTISDTAGRFQFVGLTPGAYSLELSPPGLQGQHFSHLNIEAGRTLDVE